MAHTFDRDEAGQFKAIQIAVQAGKIDSASPKATLLQLTGLIAKSSSTSAARLFRHRWDAVKNQTIALNTMPCIAATQVAVRHCGDTEQLKHRIIGDSHHQNTTHVPNASGIQLRVPHSSLSSDQEQVISAAISMACACVSTLTAQLCLCLLACAF